MAKKTLKIELSDQELKEILAKEFQFDPKNATIRVNRLEGNHCEPGYANIIIESKL